MGQTSYADFIEYEERVVLDLDRFRRLKSYQLLKGEKIGKIVDVGCLAGLDMVPLLKEGWECYGVEISWEACQKALERGIRCVNHDVSKGVPFGDEFFDAVWAEEIIEHLLDTDAFLRECYRVLKRGGILILSTPNLASLINRFRLLAGKMPRYVQYNMSGPGHVRYYTLGALREQLNRHGFKVEKVVGNFLSLPDPLPGKPIRKYILSPLGNFFPTLSENLIIKARKP